MMLELFVALCVMAIGAVFLKRRNELRLRAEETMSQALDDMYANWNVLMDAKEKYDSDVPDEVMDLATFIVKCARSRGIEFTLAMVLLEGPKGPPPKKQLKVSELREPLDEAFSELVHAWFKYVSSKNLIARHLIRNGLGRQLVKNDNFAPYNAQIVRKVAKRKDYCPPPMAAA